MTYLFEKTCFQLASKVTSSAKSLKNFILQQTSNQTQTDSLSSSPNPVSPVPLNNPTSAPRYGTVIPNRIFVGGIDFKVPIYAYNMAWFLH